VKRLSERLEAKDKEIEQRFAQSKGRLTPVSSNSG
jgi:hypothetical protein